MNVGDREQATARRAEGLALARALGDGLQEGTQLNGLALLATEAGDYARAEALYEEALSVLLPLGDPVAAVMATAALDGLGYNDLYAGDLDRAAERYEEALARARAAEELWVQGDILLGLGEVAERRGEPGRAAARYREGLVLAARLGEPGVVANGLRRLGGLVGESGQPDRAARLFGAAEALEPSIAPAEREEYERRAAAVQAALGDDVFAAAWAAGQAFSLEQAVAEALDPDPEPAAAPGTTPVATLTPPPAHHGLSPREREVLALMLRHLSAAEIAAELCLSPRTVTTHITHIYNKLGVGSRREAAAVAARHLLA
jgi:non-specific serine/threonine protein kinase